MTKEMKLVATHKSIGFTMPKKAVDLFKLKHKQKMLLYVDTDCIVIKPMEPDELRPPFMCWTRKVVISDTKRFLILPPKILKFFHLQAGNRVKVYVVTSNNTKALVLKPSRPTMHVRVKYDGNHSIVEIYKLAHDGKLDESQTPVIKKVPYAKAYNIAKALNEGDTKSIEDELEESEPLDIAVGKDYVPEVFANDKDAMTTAVGKEDESGNA